MSNIVEITEGAEEYLGNLLKDSEEKDTNIRIFVSDPGSNRAETCIVYCKPGEQDPTDFSQTYKSFNVFLDEKSLPYLEDAKVDYHPDKFGGQLTIRAPKSKTPFLSDESSIEDKINFLFGYTEKPDENISEETILDSASPERLKFLFTLLYVGTIVPEEFENLILPELLSPELKV